MKYTLALLLICGAGICAAQTTNASIYGSINDPSGAALVKATVTAVNVKTGVSLSTVSNEAGVYIFPSLQPGEYSVTGELTGFRKAVAQHIQLEVNSRISVDLKLQVGSLSESVTVESNSSPLETVNTSVSNVVTLQRVQDLPLQNRDAGALIALQAGVVGDNFNGARTQSQNVTLDGVSIQETRYNGGSASGNLVTTNSVDLVGEFRVSTAPVDSEFGRGLGQVQMIGRSGTNQYHGSAFEFNRVTALSANSWFNNQQGRKADGSLVAPRDFLIRNQFGARVGGPVIKNKTFFFFLYEAQRQKTSTAQNVTTFTALGRQGMFRFFPGVRNGNAASAAPTVDVNGNPVAPAAATGSLQTVSLFGRDPSRLTADTSGQVAKALKDYPAPNNYLLGDGLNTAGYYWQQSATADNNLYHGRIEHTLTQNTRLAFSMQMERFHAFNGYRGQNFPNQPPDDAIRQPNFWTLSATTTLRPNLLNEFRAGVVRYFNTLDSPFGASHNDVLPHIGAQPFYFNFSSGVTNTYTANNAVQGRVSSLYQYADTLSWLRGHHAMKGGVGVVLDVSNGFNSFSVIPGANAGAGNASFANISTITGIGLNQAQAQNMLVDLSRVVTTSPQACNSAGGASPPYIPSEPVQRTWRQHGSNALFKDDWKVARNITLNLGVRYEYYSPPFEANGKAVIGANGSASAFGLSGTTWADAYQPGHLAGSLTQLQLVGAKSSNPDGTVYHKQYNTFLPAIGISWSPRGSTKTVLRAGYAVSSDRNSLRNADVEVGSNPGINSTITFTSAKALNLVNVGVPYSPAGQALSTVPLTDRTQTLRLFDTGLRNQYYQNWNLSVQHDLGRGSVLTARYVGTKASRLLNGADVNAGDIFSNGFLDAFNVTRSGGFAPLFDKLFAGLSVPGQGVVDGVKVRGSDYARSNSTFATFMAQGNVGGFASNLNASSLLTGVNGGLLTNAGLPQNFFFTNPQFASVYLVGNYANSTYHGFQIEYEKRLGRLTLQSNYTWSKALGESELGGTQNYDYNYRNPRNRSFDHRIMTFNRTNVFKSNGIYELPVGRGRWLLSNANRVVDGLIGGWKLGGVLTYTSGRPFTVTAPISTFVKSTTGNTPDVAGTLPKNFGQLQFTGSYACYFCNFTQISDPSIAKLAPALAAQSTLLARQGPGGVILQNPLPGTLGNLAQTFFTGPNYFDFDASLTKQFKISERFNVELRMDWLNSTNHQDFANATLDSNINSTTFGRFTAANGNPSRIIVLGGRFNF